MPVYCLKGYSSFVCMICHDMLECTCIVGVCLVFFFLWMCVLMISFVDPFAWLKTKRTDIGFFEN